MKNTTWDVPPSRAPQLAFLDFRKVKLQDQADPKDKKKKKLVPVKKEQPDRFDALRDDRLHGPGSLAVSLRRQADLHLSARQGSAKARARGRATPFLVQHESGRRQATLPDGPCKGRTTRQYLVMIKPLLQDDKDSFSTAWVYLDKEFLLPTRIYLLAPDGKSTKDFHLSQIKPNQPVNPQFFVGVNPGKPWKIERNPGGPAPRRRQRPTRTPPPAGGPAAPDSRHLPTSASRARRYRSSQAAPAARSRLSIRMFDPPCRCAYNQVVSELVGSVRALEGMLSRSVRLLSKSSAEPGGPGTRFAVPGTGRTEARSTLGGSPAAMIRPRVTRSQAKVSPFLVFVLLNLVVACTTALGPRSANRRRFGARPVFHDHRADHPRHAHAHSRGHAATGRPQCVGRARDNGRFWFSSSCPANRRRGPANSVPATTWPS